MKRVYFLLLAPFFLFASPVFSASGSAVIPYFIAGTGNAGPTDVWYTYIFITNITNSTITVNVKLYDSAGVLLTDDGSPATGNIRGITYNTYNDNVTGASIALTIAPQESTGFYVNDTLGTAPVFVHGHGYIEWTQNGNAATNGLVAYSRSSRIMVGSHAIPTAFGLGQFAIPINNGMPF